MEAHQAKRERLAELDVAMRAHSARFEAQPPPVEPVSICSRHQATNPSKLTQLSAPNLSSVSMRTRTSLTSYQHLRQGHGHGHVFIPKHQLCRTYLSIQEAKAASHLQRGPFVQRTNVPTLKKKPRAPSTFTSDRLILKTGFSALSGKQRLC